MTDVTPNQGFQPISNDADTFVEGGNLPLHDVDGLVLKSEYVLFDFNGKVNPPVTTYHVQVQPDGDGKPRDEYLSVGGNAKAKPGQPQKPQKYLPGPDGAFLIKNPAYQGEVKGLDKSSKAGILLASYKAVGVPAGEFDKDVRKIVGRRFHWMTTTRKIKVDDEKAGAKAGTKVDLELTDVIVSAYHGVVAGVAVATSPAGNPEFVTKVQGLVQQILAEKGATPKAGLSGLIFGRGEFGSPQEKAQASQLVLDDKFSSSIPGVKLEGGVLSIG